MTQRVTFIRAHNWSLKLFKWHCYTIDVVSHINQSTADSIVFAAYRIMKLLFQVHAIVNIAKQPNYFIIYTSKVYSQITIQSFIYFNICQQNG